MRTTVLSTLVLLVLNSCISQKLNSRSDNDIYKIINLELKNNKSTRLFFKSLTSEKYNGRYIKTDGSGFNCIRDVKDPSLVRQKLDSIDNISNITRAENDSLSIMLIKRHKIPEIWKSLSRIQADQLSKNYINEIIKWDKTKIEDYGSRITKKKWDRKFSTPIFNDDKTLALMFIEYPSSLASHFYLKKNDLWYSYCSSVIRLDD